MLASSGRIWGFQSHEKAQKHQSDIKEPAVVKADCRVISWTKSCAEKVEFVLDGRNSKVALKLQGIGIHGQKGLV